MRNGKPLTPIFPESRKTGEGCAIQEEPIRLWLMCAFCGGTGTDLFEIMSRLSTYAVCDGVGVVWVKEPSQACPHFGGTGREPDMSLYCTVCKGKGVIQAGEREYEYAHK